MFSRLAHHIHCSILHVQLYLLVETISIALVCLVNQYLQLIDTVFFPGKRCDISWSSHLCDTFLGVLKNGKAKRATFHLTKQTFFFCCWVLYLVNVIIWEEVISVMYF